VGARRGKTRIRVSCAHPNPAGFVTAPALGWVAAYGRKVAREGAAAAHVQWRHGARQVWSMRDWRSVSGPHSRLLDRQADSEPWRGSSLAYWSPRGSGDVYRQHHGRGGGFGEADVEIDRDAKHRHAQSRGHLTRARQSTRLHGGFDPIPAFGPRLDDETAPDRDGVSDRP
jgi:hypothetical protein